MRAWICFFLMMSLSSCGGATVEDAGIDGGVDATVTPDAQVDAFVAICAPTCSNTEACCPLESGATSCQEIFSDVHNCGTCGTDCLVNNSGDSCMLAMCMCHGTACRGAHDAFCCPPRSSAGGYYCADLDHSASDCGMCNRDCDFTKSDRCDGGMCICGTTLHACQGTATSLCCMIGGGDARCVDSTNDINNCGGCGIGCFAGEHCESGTCRLGTVTCPAGCAVGEVCCSGACCERSECVSNACVPLPDGGMPDAG